jgi:hypothetical protein
MHDSVCASPKRGEHAAACRVVAGFYEARVLRERHNLVALTLLAHQDQQRCRADSAVARLNRHLTVSFGTAVSDS